MRRLILLFKIARHLGIKWCLFRVQWWFSKRFGVVERKSPTSRWKDIGPETSAFLNWPCLIEKQKIGSKSLEISQNILNHHFLLFSYHDIYYEDTPEWHSPGFHPNSETSSKQNPSEHQRSNSDHWSKYGDAGSTDIKLIWEMNRFAWAYSLSRAYIKTGDEKYAEKFWCLFEDWMEQNPPNTGVNWFCGQEVSIRLFAVTFAVHTLKQSKSTTPTRLNRWNIFVKASGLRINAHLEYGLSQSNNHGISECVGLMTSAILLSDFNQSKRWYQRGINNLRTQLEQLVYSDGSFAQHSANYHRLMLDDLCWLASMLRASNKKIPDWLMHRGRIATEFLADLLDPNTGRIPLYGSNDGANILPLSDSPYLDFRPTVQTAGIIFTGNRWLEAGPWDEAVNWLWNFDQTNTKPSKRQWLPNRHWKNAGTSQISSSNFRVFFRTPISFYHRPAQADMLHISLDWSSQQIALDPGTFSYNHKGKFRKSLNLANVHNTVTFADQEPLYQVSRFLMLPWPKGKVHKEFPHFIEATHNAWKRLAVQHTRSVNTTESGTILITDIVHCPHEETGQLHWLLENFPYEFDSGQRVLNLNTPRGKFSIRFRVPPKTVFSIVSGDDRSDRGWVSEHYSEARPVISLKADFTFKKTCRVETEFSPIG